MASNKMLLNRLFSILMIASMLFSAVGTVQVQAKGTKPPTATSAAVAGANPAPSGKRITPAIRQAAAARSLAKGLLPGVASRYIKPSLADKLGQKLGTNAIGGPSAPIDESVTPHYFGPYANYANSPMPRGPITSVVVDAGGTGYDPATTVTIADVYGTGYDAVATPTIDPLTGAITAISVLSNPGADYTAPIVVIQDPSGLGSGAAATANIGEAPGSLTGGIRKFVDSLPGLGPTGANNLGNYIPVGTPDIVTFPGADYYEIELGEYTQQLHSDLPATTLRGYRQINSAGGAAPTPFSYLGPTIVATKGRAVRIKFINNLPTGAGGDLNIPVDTTIMGAGMGNLDAAGNPCDYDVTPTCESYSENRATLHLHGGLVTWISDGTPHQWTTPAGENTKYPNGVSVQYVPDMWYDANGDVIPNTVGLTTAAAVAAVAGSHPAPYSNNPSGPTSLHGGGALTFYYNNDQSARLMFYHDHAYGITRLNVYEGEAAGYLITDSIEGDLMNGTNTTGVNPSLKKLLPGLGTPLVIQEKTFVDETTIAAQDPTWKWGTGAPDPDNSNHRVPRTGDLWVSSVYMPIQNPWDVGAGANAYGRWQYGPWFYPPTTSITYLPGPNPYYDPGCDPALTWCEPPLQPTAPTPSTGMEAFNDTMMVNGAVYPYVNLNPQLYRFRVLNAANDRFVNLSLFVADSSVTSADGRSNTEVKMVPAAVQAGWPANWPGDGRAGGVPDPALAGPSWIRIGTEGGFLPAPVVIPPLPISWEMNPGLFAVGNVTTHSLELGPAERADVLVDFSAFANQTLILYNDAPAAFPALDPRYDYYTGDPAQMDSGGTFTTLPGFGPNTRTVMQIRIGATADAGAVALDLPGLQAAFAKTNTKPSVFEASHPDEPIIVPQAAYNSAYNMNLPGDAAGAYVQIGEASKTFTPLYSTTPVTINFQPKAMHDEMGAAFETTYGRMTSMLGLEVVNPNNATATIILSGYASPPTDLMTNTPNTMVPLGSAADGTQIWKITHNGVDSHPIHFHLFNVQLVNRVGWDGQLIPPREDELGWKETVRVDPLEDTIVAMRAVAETTQPFDIPNSHRLIDPTKPVGSELMSGGPAGIITPGLTAVQVFNHIVNYGWEYVWHCHILSHEEMDMMHALTFGVAPRAPSNLSVTQAGSTVTLKWDDNSVSETGYTIFRTQNGVTTSIPIASTTEKTTTAGTGTQITYQDPGLSTTLAYTYQVMATNDIGDPVAYDPAGGNFPTATMESTLSNAASNKIAVTAIAPLAGSANPTSAASVAFTVTFNQPVSVVTATNFSFATGVGYSTGATISSVSAVNPVAGSSMTWTVNVNTSAATTGLLQLNLTNTSAINPTITGTFTTGTPFTIEKVGPLVVSINRASANPTKATGVNFTVTFDKIVTGVSLADFTLTTTGLTGASIKSLTGSGKVYTVTVLTGSSDIPDVHGTLKLNLIDSDAIKGPSGVPLGGTGAGNGTFTTGQLYDVDTRAPLIASFTPNFSGTVLTDSVTYTLTFSEPVTGVDKADFTLTTTGLVGAGVTVAGSGTTYTITVNTGSIDIGTFLLKLMDNNTIVDWVGNPLGGAGFQHFTSFTAVSVAKPFRVFSMTKTSSDPIGVGTVNYKVTFSNAATVVGTSAFVLTPTGTLTGASVASATRVTGSTTAYNVIVNTGTSGAGTLRLDVLADGTITDPTSAPLGVAFNTGPTYTVDLIPPVVSSIALTPPTTTNAATVTYTVTFSEPVTGVLKADFGLTSTGTIAGASVASFSGTGTTRTVIVNTGTGEGTLRLDVLDHNNIIDAVGNQLGGAGTQNYISGPAYTLDLTPPTTVSITGTAPLTTKAAVVTYTVIFSEAVTGVDAADFSLTNTGAIAGASVGVPTGSGTTWSVPVNTGTGSGTLKLNLIDNNTIMDIATNPLGGAGIQSFTTATVFTLDKTVPTVTSINRLVPLTTSTALDSVTFQVIFSEAVTGVDTADFALTTTAVGASITSIAGSGTTYQLVVNTGTSINSTIRLDLIDNNTIIDAVGNTLGGAGVQSFITGQTYTIVKLPLAFAKSSPANAATGISTSPTMNWAASTYATSYQYCIDTTNNNTCNATWVTANFFPMVLPGLAANTTYSWTVRAVNANGNTQSDGGTWWTFTTWATAPTMGTGTWDDTNNAWVYTSSWVPLIPYAGAYNNTSRYTTAVGGSATIQINGGSFKLFYTASTNRGLVDVYVDGIKITQINEAGTPIQYQKSWTSGTLSAGTHVIRFVYVSGGLMEVDAIQILP